LADVSGKYRSTKAYFGQSVVNSTGMHESTSGSSSTTTYIPCTRSHPATPPHFSQIADGVDLVVPVSITDRTGNEVVHADITTWVTPVG
jgi:hypothetical protein